MYSLHCIPLTVLSTKLDIKHCLLFDFGKELSYLFIHALCYQFFSGMSEHGNHLMCKVTQDIHYVSLKNAA